MSLLDHMRFFRTEQGPTEEEQQDLAKAHALLEMTQMRGFSDLMAWIDGEAVRMIDTHMAHADLIAAAARSNSFREIRAKIRSDTARAERLIAEARRI